MEVKEIVLLELFSGIGGFAKGFIDAGYTIKKHYFSEIDKYAIANYRYNFKNSEYVGSVTDVHAGGIEHPDVVTFGSPCQDFSLAGKRAGLEGDRSVLILEAIRIIRETRPSIFIWENVKGVFSSNAGADFWAVIAALADIGGYRLEWQLLNTSWFLPQNRERIYLIGHLAGRSEPVVFPFREDDFGVDERSSKTTNVGCLAAGGHSGGMHSSMTLLKVNLKDGIRENQSDVSSMLQSRDWKGYSNQDMDFVKVQPKINVVGNVGNGHEAQNVYDPEGLAPTVRENHGKVTKITIPANTQQGYEVVEEGDSVNFSVPSSKTRRGRVGKQTAQTLDTSANQGVVVPVRWVRSEKGKEARRENKKQGKDYTPFSDGNRELIPTDDNNSGCVTGATNKDALICVKKPRINENCIKTPDDISPAITATNCSKNSECQPWIMRQRPNFPYKDGERTLRNEFYDVCPTISSNVAQGDQKNMVVMAPTLHGFEHGTNRNYQKQLNGMGMIRRLTEVECERLQGFPDFWTEYGYFDGTVKKIVKTQRYKMLGNAVTVRVVEEIAKRLRITP